MAKEIRGIDLSEWNGSSIDGNAIKASGVEVVILRVHQLYGIDKSFVSFYNSCKQAGLKIGVYKYSYAMNVAEAQKEARAVLECLNGRKLDYPVFYDMEDSTQANMSKSQLTAIIKGFLDIIEDAGYIPAIYCNTNWYNNILDRNALSYDYWLASVPGESSDNGLIQERLRPNGGMGWQYSWKGRVPGVRNDTDMNVFYKSAEDYASGKSGSGQVSDPYAAAVESAVKWMENTAADDSHGYDQQYRWGERGDWDCSASIIYAFEQAGIPVKTNGATYTGNMKPVFLKCGFKDVTSSINLATGAGLVRGDVLLNIVNHVALYCGDGMEVEASINEFGGVRGGAPGDQTGKEFLKKPYRNYPWDCVLRLGNGASASKPTETFKATGTAVVTANDLFLRQTPNGKIIGLLQNGNRVEIDGKKSGNWTHVNDVSGQGVGYVWTGYIKIDVPPDPVDIKNKVNIKKRRYVARVTADELNVRTWAGTENKKIKAVPVLYQGNLVDVCSFDQKDSNGDVWNYVRIQNGVNKKTGKKKYVYGFCHSDYLARQ